MSAIKKFDHPKELLHKLYREGRRANLANSELDIVDYVFNFCVTGHSLRDWIIKHLQLNESQKSKFHDQCNLNEYLKYCRDIANSSKHFGLDLLKQSTVSSVNTEKVEFCSIDTQGNLIPNSNIDKLSAKVEIAQGNKIDLLMFIHYVAEAFKEIFVTNNIEFDVQLTNSAILAGYQFR